MFYPGWTHREKQFDAAYLKLDEFFEELQANAEENINGVKIAYREPQNKFALTVMEAIKERKILLIEAGVGTGKSLGYLVPIFYTMDEVTKFDKVIISTSSIALQEQLLNDIGYVAQLLGIKIKSGVSKGINNYACIKRIERKMESSKRYNDSETHRLLTLIKNEITKKGSSDKNDLPLIQNELWSSIRVNGGCERCETRNICPFIEEQRHIENVPIVVTNHTQLSNIIKRQEDVLSRSSLLVVDEAHKLEEQMRLAYQGTINFNSIFKVLDFIERDLINYELDDTEYDLKYFRPIHKKLIEKLYEFAKNVRSDVRSVYRRQNNREYLDIHDCEKLNFRLHSKYISEPLEEIEKLLSELCIYMKTKMLNIFNKEKYCTFISETLDIFKDMLLQSKSKNVYWVRFIDDNRVEIIYTLKDLSKYFERIFGQDKPVIFTSGTMTTNANSTSVDVKTKYEHFQSSLNLLDNKNVEHEFPMASPFDYENHTLFYYDDTMPHPNDSDRDIYIQSLAIKIRDLIETTEGKALILFTSKSDMVAVYNIVKHMGLKQNLILQDEKNPNVCKEEFTNDQDSCLFATGVFWEGLDIPGKTLSNLIIAKLPFPVQDPIVEYRKSLLPKTEQSKVDLNEMLMKLSQGTGRLIRSVKDTGVVCCLDCRTSKYLEAIKQTLPFTTYTNDIDKVIDFSINHILVEEPVKPFIIKPIEAEENAD